MFHKRINIQSQYLVFIAALFFLTAYNLTFWQQIIKYGKVGQLLATAVLLTCMVYGILTLATFKYVFKPFLTLTFFLAAISAYAMDSFGYLISTEAFRNLVETDTREVLDLITPRLLATLLVLFLLPSIVLLFTRIQYPTLKLRFIHFSVCLLLVIANILLFSGFYTPTFRNHRELKFFLNPIRPLYSMVKYTATNLHPQTIVVPEFVELDSNPTRLATGKPKLLVLVVGESDRAINHQLNGYTKPTNPLLSARKDIYSFDKVYSCGTETTVSLPCMLSVFKREEYTHNKGLYTENVLDLLQKSNVQVLWRDNDSGCKNVCDRVTTHDLNFATIQPYCQDKECHDEILLHDLDKYIKENVGDKVIVLHKKGNHGPAYYRRYPERFNVFTPICATNELQKCTNEQIINTYDNIVVYTDYFLDQVIKHLENNNDQYQTAMIYVSDHGESLGEKGIYLHALPYWMAPKEQIHVPFIFWASPDFAIDRERLAQIRNQEFSHDHLFHSLLGLFAVQTPVYQAAMDMFANG